jgi:hypothetical protein
VSHICVFYPSDVMPVLSHHDWSIPQAKQILSHWATLATLLAGTQATLMGYYEKDNAQGEAFNFVIASSCAGLFLEVYGALLAAATIIASISLQAPPASATNTQAEKKPLSPRAAAILDRMTVSCIVSNHCFIYADCFFFTTRWPVDTSSLLEQSVS